VAILILCAVKVQAKETVSLPGEPISFVLDYNTKGELVYDLSYKGVKLIEQSPIGMNNADGVSYTPENFKIELCGTSGESGTLTPVWGKRSMMNKHYIQKSYQITPLYPLTNEHNTPPRVYLEVRVYEGAVAFRYRCVLPQPSHESIVPVNTIIENTKFNFAGDFTAWYYNGERHNIGPELLSRASGERLPVMTIKAKDNIYMAIHEADVNEKALPMRLQTEQGSTSFSVVTEPLDFQTKYVSPWRVILLGETPGALVDSDVLTLLNPEPAKGMDFSWVKPATRTSVRAFVSIWASWASSWIPS
jgi:alpha-glucosidase